MTVIALIIFLVWRVVKCAARSMLIMVMRRGWGPNGRQLTGEASGCRRRGTGDQTRFSSPLPSLPSTTSLPPSSLCTTPSEGGLCDGDGGDSRDGGVAVAGLRDWSPAWGARLSWGKQEQGEPSHKQRSVPALGTRLWSSSRAGQLHTVCSGPSTLTLTDEPGDRGQSCILK